MGAVSGGGKVLTVSDVAQMFRVDPKTVTRWAKTDKFPPGAVFRTPGGHRRYYRDKIETMMADLGYRPETIARG